MVHDAIIRQIEIIGEASKNIRADLRKKYKDVPWKRIIGMRNKVIHEYFGVRLEIVWEAIHVEIPKLKDQINRIILDLSPQTSLELNANH